MPQPTIDEMYGDLEEADRLGDKELATNIASQIKAAEYTAGRQQEAQSRDQTMSTAWSKVPGGIVEGIKRIGEGFQQLGAAGGEITGLMSQGSVAQQTADMNTRRLAATGGDPDTEAVADATEGVGLMIPGVDAARGIGILRKLPATTTALKATLRGMRQGAVAGGIANGASETAEEPADVLMQRLEMAALGGTLVGTGQLAAGSGAAIANFWTRQTQKADTIDATLREMRNSWDVGPMPISVATGNKTARAIEIQVQNNTAQKFFNRMFERFAGKVDEVNNSIKNFASNPDPSHFDVVSRINKAWISDRRQTQQAMSTLYGKRLSSAVETAAADPKLYPVPWLNTARVTNEWKNATDGIPWWRRVAPGAEKITPELAQLDTYMTRSLAVNARNTTDVRELMLMRRNLNDLDRPYWNARENNPNGPSSELVQAHRANKDLLDAVDADIQSFIDKNPGDRPAVQALKEFISANEDYSKFKQVDRLMQQTAVGQMFGFRVPDQPAKALDALARMEPAEQKRAMNVLRSQDPEAILDLRAVLVNDAFSKTMNVQQAASRGRVNPEAWGKAMTSEHGLIGQEIFTAPQRAQFERGLSTVRLIRDTTEGLLSPARSPSIEGTVMAGASRSSAFLARALLRIGGLGKVENLLFTPEGLKSLETIRNASSWKTKQVTAAIVKIGAIAGMTPEEGDLDEFGRQ